MKLFIFWVSLALLCMPSQAQLKATTEDGREVLLHDDGTWEFADPDKGEEESSGRGMDTQKIINEHCEEEWSTDFQMQAFCRDNQVKAATKLARGKPADVSEKQWNQIFGNCWSQWVNDFQMTEFCVSNQIEALRKLR